MVNRYNGRPHSSFAGGKCSDLNELCYTEFLRYYYSVSKAHDGNDNQPGVLKDETSEDNLTDVNSYPNIIPLMPSKGKLKC